MAKQFLDHAAYDHIANHHCYSTSLPKNEQPRNKRRVSTKSSPDSRQRSHERAYVSNPKVTAKTTLNQQKGLSQNEAKRAAQFT